MDILELKTTLQDLIYTPETQLDTLAALCELAPHGHEGLRSASERLYIMPTPCNTKPLSPLALSVLKHAGRERHTHSAPPQEPARRPTQREAHQLALLKQLEALLLDVEISLPLLRQTLTPLERLRRTLTVEVAQEWIRRARATRAPRALSALAEASRRLGDLVLDAPERWLDEATPLLLKELAPLAQEGAGENAGEGEAPNAPWAPQRLTEAELHAVAQRPPLLAALSANAEERAALGAEGGWRRRLRARVPPEALTSAARLAARLVWSQRVTVKGFGFNMIYCPRGEVELKVEHLESVRRGHLAGGFWIGETPVTQALWRRVTGETPSEYVGARRPMHGISHLQAIRFCNALSALEGLPPAYAPGALVHTPWAVGYRLPTEAEWVYAAKAGTRFRFAGSDSFEEVAWVVNGTLCGPYPVALLRPNAWGLYDMSGNVSDWCLRGFGPEVNHPNNDEFVQWIGESFICRGGSWRASEHYAEVDNRCYWGIGGRASMLSMRLVRLATEL